MKTCAFICLTLALLVSQIECWQSLIVPLSFDNKTNQWNVLLGKVAGMREWSFFGKTAHGKGNAQRSAVEALREQTNGMINMDESDLKGKVWFRLDEDIVHFTPVTYIPAGDLYRAMRPGGVKDDYAWLPRDEIIGKNSITKSVRGAQRTYRFSRETEEILKLLDQALRQQLSKGARKQKKASTDSWKGLGNAIYFYESQNLYYAFTNFAPYSVTDAQGYTWPTSENFFQAQKFVDNPQLYNQMKQLQTPRDAFNFVRNQSYDKNVWNKKSVAVMLDAVRRKFEEHLRLKHMLLNTGNKILVEDAGKNDAFWGAGAQGEGTNLLGQVLMRIRDEIAGKAAESDDFVWYENYRNYHDQQNGKLFALRASAEVTKKPVYVQPKKPQIGDKSETVLIQKLEKLVAKLQRLENLLV